MDRAVGLLAVLVAAAVALPSGPTSAAATPIRDDVDAYVQRTMDALPIAGMAVAVVQAGEIVHVAGYGTADTAGTPVTVETPFPVASITKSFTTLAARQLAAEGLLDLSAPVRSIVAEFRLADAAGGQGVTVQHLIDHTSGISTYEGTRPYLHDPDQTFAGALATLAGYRPSRAPGDAYEYSNWNAVLLGEVIARAAGRPYLDQVTDRILRPLGMDKATFADPRSVPGAATGNLLVLGFRRPFDDPYVPVMASAGNLTVSVEELAGYLLELATGGATVLPATGRGWYDTVWRWTPGLPNDVATSFSGAHNGYNATIQLLPADSIGVVVLANTRLDVLLPTPTTEQISLELARLVAGQPAREFARGDVARGYIWLDTVLGLLAGAVLWQLFRLRGWAGRYRHAATGRQVLAWTGIVSAGSLAAAFAAAPAALDTSWIVILNQRAIVAWPMLAVAAALALVALTKVGLLRAAHRHDRILTAADPTTAVTPTGARRPSR